MEMDVNSRGPLYADLLPREKKKYGSTNVQGYPPSTHDFYPTSEHRASAVDDVLNRINCGAFQIIAFFLAGLTYFAFICEALTFSLMNLQITQQWNLTGLTYAILPATTGATNILGGILFGYLADTYGRVWPYALSMFLTAAFVLASAFSPSFYVLVALRGLASVSVGAIPGLVYPMLLEFLPVKRRGPTGVLLMFVQTIGSCVTAGLAWWLIPIYHENSWRYFIIVSAVPSFFVVAYRLLFFFQSPRYLIGKGKIRAAWKTFTAMAWFNCKKIENYLHEEEFVQSVTMQRVVRQRHYWKRLLRMFRQGYFCHTLCLTAVYVALQMASIGSSLFLPVILKNLQIDPYFGMFIAYAAQVPGIFLMAIVIEWPWFGRLNSLRVFTIMTAIFFFLFAFIQTPVTVPLFTMLFSFCLSPLLSLAHIYVAESYPTEIRAMAVSFYSACGSLSNIWVPFCSAYLASLSLTYPWLFPTVWGAVTVFAFTVSLGLRRETRGQRLEDTFMH